MLVLKVILLLFMLELLPNSVFRVHIRNAAVPVQYKRNFKLRISSEIPRPTGGRIGHAAEQWDDGVVLSGQLMVLPLP